MEATIVNRFEKLWDDYLVSFKGALMEESQKQSLSYLVAKSLLQDVTLSWTTGYGLNCRWLDQLLKDSPEKGNLVREIITNDISLKEIWVQQDYSEYFKYGVPIGAGVAGFLAGNILGSGALGTVTATIVPIAIAVSLTNSWLKTNKEKKVEELIDTYVNQLEKYKQSIISVLLAD